jgi:hypothetical protein
MLYMFQAVTPPIIRSSKLYIQQYILVKPLLLPAAIPDAVYTVFELLMMGGGTA